LEELTSFTSNVQIPLAHRTLGSSSFCISFHRIYNTNASK
jgi:hypothetical protein